MGVNFAEEYQQHRSIASQVKALYTEIKSLAVKKPSERVSPLVSKKVNHVLAKVKEQVREDEFLDAIESLPVSGDMSRYDEVQITLAELKAALDRQWGSEEYVSHRQEHGSIVTVKGGMYLNDDSQTF